MAGTPSMEAGVSRIIERMQDGYFRVSPEGQILTINPAAVRILDYDNADEMVGQVNVVELYADPVDRDAVLAELREHGEITGYEVNLKRKDGTVVRVELTVAGVLDADGRLVAQDGTLRDVSERHRQAQELERSEQQIQSLVQNVPGAIYRYQEQDGEWVCTFMSDAIEEITGFPVEYFIGQSTDQFRDLVHPDDLALFDGGVGNATEQDDGVRFEYRITSRDGGVRWIGARGSDPVVGSDGQSYIDGSIYDATREHELPVGRNIV